MRLRANEAELRAAVRRTLNNAPDPDPEDLIELYLFLPVVVEHPTVGRVKVRSSLEALLTDAHRVTGRDYEGNVVEAPLLGTWLGAMGYLSLIDQVGKALRWRDRPDKGDTQFEAILLQRGLDEREAAVLYALRNAMVHSYGLANENTKRPELQHLFRLGSWGGSPRVKYPARPWGGDPNDVQDQETTVSLQAVGNLAEELVLELAENWQNKRNLAIAHGLTPDQMRRRYFFAHPDPLVQE